MFHLYFKYIVHEFCNGRSVSNNIFFPKIITLYCVSQTDSVTECFYVKHEFEMDLVMEDDPLQESCNRFS